MKKHISLIVLALFIGQSLMAQTKWTAKHTNVRFEVDYMGITVVQGFFKNVKGHATTKRDTVFDGARFSYTIPVSTLDTGIEKRNEHLIGPEYFNAAKHPTITLSNARLSHEKGNSYQLNGELTMNGITKPVRFEVTKNGIITDWDGTEYAGFTATASIDRTDFGLEFYNDLPGGIPVVGKTITITVNTELVKTKSA